MAVEKGMELKGEHTQQTYKGARCGATMTVPGRIIHMHAHIIASYCFF